MKLNGWRQIGLFISVIWAAGAWGIMIHYVRDDGMRRASDAFSRVYEPCREKRGAEYERKIASRIARDESPTEAEQRAADRAGIDCLESARFELEAALLRASDEHRGEAEIAAFTPILLGWILTYLCIWITRWIRRDIQPTQ